jgi:hypothetical protein
MDFYRGNIPIIDDDGPKFADMLYPDGFARGYVERDYATSPATMFSALPSTIKIIPASEYDARYDEQEEQKSSLEHLYLRGGQPAFVNLDQNGHGDCWAFSTGHAIMLDRLKGNQPMVRMNPHGVAVMLNQLNGGWCGLSAKFAREHGMPVDGNGAGEWPGHSRSKSHDTPTLRAQMAAHKVSEEFVDLTRDVYDQNMTVAQHRTCLMNNQPCPSDFNWWGHSVCAIRLVRIEAGDWGILILNSWLDWGRNGLGVLRGSKAIPDGSLSILVSGASDA